MFLNIPLSAQLTSNFSVGASFITLIETIKVNGLSVLDRPLFSIYPSNFTNNFTYTTFGAGGLVGALFKVNDYLNIGASYQSQITPGKLKPYQGLFPNGRIEVPEKITIGTSIQFNPLQTIRLSMHQYEFGISWTWLLDNKSVVIANK